MPYISCLLPVSAETWFHRSKFGGEAFLESSAEQLGSLVALRELNWHPFSETIRFYEKGTVPLDRKMITPGNLALANQIQLVHEYRMTVPDPD